MLGFLIHPIKLGKGAVGREKCVFSLSPCQPFPYLLTIFYAMGSRLRGLALLILQRGTPPHIVQRGIYFLDQHLLHNRKVDVVDSADITIGLWAHVPRL